MDEGLLTVEQVLLLENLTYLEDKGNMRTLAQIDEKRTDDALTVGQIIDTLEIDQLDENINYSTYENGKDWYNVLNAIKQDKTLCGMTMIAVKDGSEETGGTSAVFYNAGTGEVVVAFRGTEKFEWKDNFLGGALTILEVGMTNMSHDGVSTFYQEEALKWYQGLDIPNLTGGEAKTITVTGHSKGGNKAKYITIRDDSVTRCLSYDGQGFSDEFVEKYARRIAEREYAISNHNVEFDYVNLLLNDVGEKTYYVGFGYGVGLLLEAHCPNTFFKYNEDGEVEMVVAEGQQEVMIELDKFFNSYLRTLPDEKKVETMELIGEIAQAYLGADEDEYGNKIREEGFSEIVSRMNGWDEIGNLLAYLRLYVSLHPELLEAVDSVMAEFYSGTKAQTIYVVIKTILIDAPTTGNSQIAMTVANLGSLMPAGWSMDRQVIPVCRPLERNRVFGMSELLELGDKGKSLMETGAEACRVWDGQLSRLEDLLGCLPAEVDASGLKSALAQRGVPFYSDEYETMGTLMYNTTNRIVDDMQSYDAYAARNINDIAGTLEAVTLYIKELEERIWET